MTSLKIKLILAGLICFFAAIQSVNACSCYPQPAIYETFQNSSAVFTGKVLSFRDIEREEISEEDGKKEVFKFKERIFRFQILENLKGIKTKEVEVSVGPVQSSCYRGFTVGESYLIYADAEGEILSHSFCSRSEPLFSADTQLYFIREFLRGSKESQLYGSVSFVDTYPNSFRPRITKLEKIKVLLTGKQNLEAITDKNGFYRFNNIPDGTYKLTAQSNDSYITYFPEDYDVKVENGKISYDIVGFRFSEFSGSVFADFNFGWKNSVVVKVYDANGKPVKNAAVRLLPVNLPFEKIRSNYILDTDDAGQFFCSNETPGKYYLTAEIFASFGQNDRIRIFYPQAETPDKASPIDLKAKDELSFDLILPAKYITREIRGQAVWSDGQPANSASVSLQKSEILVARNNDRVTTDIDEVLDHGFDWGFTDEQGNFVLQGFEGGEYWLHFENELEVIVNGEERDVEVKGKPVKIKIGKTNEPLKIILKKP
jgi:hypothetical protein